MSLLPPFNLAIPSYFSPPLKGELEEVSSTEIVARTLLSMHRQKSSQATYELKAVSGISVIDVDLAVTKIEGVFNRSFTKSIIPSKTEGLALLLLHLEEGSPANQVLDEFNKLDYEDLIFLCDSVSQGDPNNGFKAIRRDPFLLLRLKNSQSKNPVEFLLEKYWCEGIKTHLKALEGKSLDEIKASLYFNLLCNFIRFEVGSAGYSESLIYAKLEELFSGSPSRIDRLCGSLEALMLGDRDSEAFHEIAGFNVSFAKADTDAYVKIAKAMPKRFDLSKLCEIKEEKLRIEIAKVAAAQSGAEVSAYIQKYGIDPANQTALIEIAKIAAAQDGERVSIYIKNYRICDRAALIEIAKIAAAQEGGGVSCYIKNYRIIDQAALIEIAKIAVSQSAFGTSEYIQDYGIDPVVNQAALIEIAKIGAAQDGYHISKYIQSFGITNQAALIEIAKIAVSRSPFRISEYIQNYGIDPENQAALIEIAKIAAAQSGAEVSWGIKHFGIDPENQAALIEIAKIAAAQSGAGVSEYIQNYGINPKNQEALIEIAKIAAAQIRLETPMLILTPEIARHMLNYGIKSVWEIKNAIEPGCLGEKELDATYKAILGYRNPAIKSALSLEFLMNLGDEAYRKRYASLLLNEKKQPIAHLRLPMVFVAKFMETPESPEGAAIRTKFLEYREKWKDAKSNLLSSALNALNLLDQNSILSSKQKLQLLSQVAVISTDAASLKLNLQKMAFLLATRYFLNGSEDLLKQRTSEKFDEDFNEIFIAHIKKQMLEGVSVGPVFIEKYLELTFSQREPFALEQYAARIEEPLVKKEMDRFILSIVNGDFREVRYSTLENPHLLKLASYRREGEAYCLWERWQNLSSFLPARAGAGAGAGARASAGAGAGVVLLPDTEETTTIPSFKDWLYQKLITDKHLLKLNEKLPYLFAFLNKTRESEELLLSESLKPIEKASLLLCSEGSLDKKLVVLKELLTEFEKDETLSTSEWKNDIKGMLLQLTSKGVAEFKGGITDDWQDLFLCGTEVAGSCQRIDASQSTAKCLLGYCMDGKVQVIALKDPKSGKLLARAILKLLLKEEVDPAGKKVLKPVIFLERIYANTMSDAYTNAINTLAIERAKTLGIELYTLNPIPSSSAEVGDLRSLGSSSPYEYEDGLIHSLTGGITNGEYLLQRARKIVLG